MKNVFKKITAVAMALTLLGVGANIAPQSNNQIVVNAATCNNCHGGSYHVCYSQDWVRVGNVYFIYSVKKCGLCGNEFSRTLINVKPV